MPIEALYPYIAVAYGTFGLVFGVMLWWKTQRRIDRTRAAIETQVAAAVEDIAGKVDEKLGAFEDTEIDMTPITECVDSLKADLPDMIAKHIEMHYRAIQSEDAKRIGKMLEEMNITGIAEEQKELLISRLTTKQKAAHKLMTLKVPKSVRDENPLAVMLFENSRGIVAEALMGDENTVVDAGPGPSGRGIGVR